MARGRDLIQDEDLGVSQESSSNANELPLADREVLAVLNDLSVELSTKSRDSFLEGDLEKEKEKAELSKRGNSR